MDSNLKKEKKRGGIYALKNRGFSILSLIFDIPVLAKKKEKRKKEEEEKEKGNVKKKREENEKNAKRFNTEIPY